VTLTPLRTAEAPIAIAFTTFPSLLVRCGRWFVDGFPSCGCDACADTAEGEGERLNALLGDVVAGRFREELVIPFFGRTTLRWAFGDASCGHRRESYAAFTRKEARMLRDAPSGKVPWQPWSRRADGERVT